MSVPQHPMQHFAHHQRHWRHTWWQPWHHYRHKWHLVLTVQGVSVFLTPMEKVHMAVTLAIGHTLGLALTFLDQNGNPMLTTPVPDATPVWSDTTPATETLVADASGLTATGTPVAVGQDTINVSLAVGGVTFTAALDVTVTAAAQVLTSVAIAPTVS